jgi:hypothetical protein
LATITPIEYEGVIFCPTVSTGAFVARRNGKIFITGNSGFPKSHNISKAIDKMGGESLDWFIDYILDFAEEKGISKKDLTMLFPSKNGNPTGWLWNKQHNQSITLEQYNTIKDFLGLDFPTLEEAKREIVGVGKAGLTKGNIATFSGDVEFAITAPATEKAKEWEGFGSALKPAVEPIVLARKPLEKGLSIAENVLKWGTGAINIDGCRICFKNKADYKESTQKNQHADFGTKPLTNNIIYGDYSMVQPKNYQPEGRFPSNFLMSHHPECECKGLKKIKPSNGSGKASEKGGGFGKGMFGDGNSDNIGGGFTDENGQETVEHWECHENCPIKIMDEQSGVSKSGKNIEEKGTGGIWQKSSGLPVGNQYGDTGGASRFFYIAKASKSERNRGLNKQSYKLQKNIAIEIIEEIRSHLGI